MVFTKSLMILICTGFFSVANAQEGKTESSVVEKTVVETTESSIEKNDNKVKKEKLKKDAAKGEKATAKREGKGKMTTVVMETSLGTIEIELDGEKAPISTENFLKYVDSKHYDGTIFHRVIQTFMIQGGGFDENFGEKKGRAPIQNEAANGLKNERGSIAMARTGEPHSATAQFFINVVNNKMLDFRDPSPGGIGYAVFGKVTKGMDVVDKIKDVATGSKGHYDDVPKTNVVIKSVKRK